MRLRRSRTPRIGLFGNPLQFPDRAFEGSDAFFQGHIAGVNDTPIAGVVLLDCPDILSVAIDVVGFNNGVFDSGYHGVSDCSSAH